MPKSLSRRHILTAATAAASAAIGASLPAASAGLSPRLQQLLEQRARLNAEIDRLLSPHRAAYPRVPDAIRIEPEDASPKFLQSGCASFDRDAVHGEACLWGTGGWWEACGDAERQEIARRHAIVDCSEWDRRTDGVWNQTEHIRHELGALEYEIAKVNAASVEDLRALAHVASEQFLSGRTDDGIIPYAFVANVLRVIG